MTKTAIITGVLGQDGSYLAKLLVEKNYQVYGLARKSNMLNLKNLIDLKIDKEIQIVQGDIADELSTSNLISKTRPDEFYNLAAQSNANASWQLPRYTANVNATGSLTVLEALRNNHPDCRYFQAGSSDQFGNLSVSPVNENTVFAPENPYAVSKLYAYHMTRNYRMGYNMHASNGILFNHESPVRAENFIMSKIVHGAVRIKLGQQQHIVMGSIDVVRDWGYAPDFVEAMWAIVQHDTPDDYVVCTGRPASFEDLIRITFEYLGFNDWRPYVKIDPTLQRPTEVRVRYGDPAYIKNKLGWAAKTSLENILGYMIEQTLRNLAQ